MANSLFELLAKAVWNGLTQSFRPKEFPPATPKGTST